MELLVRTIDLARARMKIGLATLINTMSRAVWLTARALRLPGCRDRGLFATLATSAGTAQNRQSAQHPAEPSKRPPSSR